MYPWSLHANLFIRGGRAPLSYTQAKKKQKTSAVKLKRPCFALIPSWIVDSSGECQSYSTTRSWGRKGKNASNTSTSTSHRLFNKPVILQHPITPIHPSYIHASCQIPPCYDPKATTGLSKSFGIPLVTGLVCSRVDKSGGEIGKSRFPREFRGPPLKWPKVPFLNNLRFF